MNSNLPSRTEAWARLRASEPPGWVLDHVAAVERLAIAMGQLAVARGHRVDLDLLGAGAVLHDIGRSVTQDPTHAHIGAELLRDDDADTALVNIVERHTGAGLLPSDAEAIGIPIADYTPITLEEKLVAHADNLYSGAKRLKLADIAHKYKAKGLPEAFDRIAELHAELESIIGMDPEQVTPVTLPAA